MQIFGFNNDGFYIKPVILKEEDMIPPNYTTVQPTHGLFKPKWTGSEWVEGMSQEEIDALNNVPKEPTEIEKLQNELSTVQGALDFIILNY